MNTTVTQRYTRSFFVILTMAIIHSAVAGPMIGTKQVTYNPTSFHESSANNGTIDNSTPLGISLTEETFTGTNGEDFVATGKIVVSNVPSGLTVVAQRSTATQIYVTLTGTAGTHTAANNVNNLTIAFQNGAFTGGSAMSVSNSNKSDLQITYLDPVVTLTGFSPAKNTLNITPSSNITLTFNEAMSEASIVPNTSVRIHGSVSGRHGGSVSYNNGTNTATIDPASDFAQGEMVTITVTTQVINAGGFPLAQASVWSFSVASAASDSLGSLVNVATVTTAIVPAAADLDNDGDIDIATANYTNNSISVMLNSGSRTFAAPVPYTLAASVRSISSADVDNDGDMDLIAAVNNSTLAILKNNDNGTFAAAVNYAVGQLPTFIAVADIDGDGDLDIASGNFDSNTISVITNNGSGVFSASTGYSGLTSVHGVQFSDVDGDKDMDLVGLGYTSSNIGVWMNNGSGTFSGLTAYSTGANPVDVRAADVDGDGDMDLITPNAGGNSVSVLKNNGNGTLAAKTDYSVGLLPYMAIPADVDGDGDIDIAVACVNGLALNVLRNNGSGTFTAVSYPLGFGVAGVAAADMDGDGKLDLIISSHTDNLVKVLYADAPSGRSLSFNSTDGYGKVAIPTPTAYTIEMWVKPADVTSRIIGAISDDTGPATSYNTHQIGITSDHKFQHYLYDGSLRFVTGTTTVVAGRWYHVAITAANNGQMRLFVNGVEEGTAVSIGTMFASVNTYFFGMSSPHGSAYTGLMDNIRIWNTARTGSQIAGSMFTEFSGAQSGLLANYRCSQPTATVAYDSSGNNRTLTLKGSGYGWNGTGFPSQPSIVSVSPAANSNTLLRSGNITATFSIAMDAASFVSGSTVKVVGSQSGVHTGTAALSNGGATMTFDPAVDFAAGEYVDVSLTTGITSADIVPLAAKRSWRFMVRPVAADTFAASIEYGSGLSSAYSLGMADIDGDGDNDAAVVNYGGSKISIMKNNGAGVFPDKTDYTVGAYPTSVFLADVDGDGDKDMLYTRYISNVVGVMMNNGSGVFAAATEYAGGTTTITVTAADVDGDGDLDIIAGNFGAATISILKNNGNGTLAARSDYGGGRMAAVVPADMDGDGDIDIVTHERSDGVVVCLNNGQGAFSANTSYNYTGSSGMVEWVDAADIDGDGDADVVTVDQNWNAVTVTRNNGNATFSSHVTYFVGSYPTSARFMDVDGDGDLDLGVTNASGNSVTILKNAGDGTFGQRSDYSVGSSPYSLQSSDVNNDGRLDLLMPNFNSDNISVLLNTTFAALPVELTSFTAASRGSGVELRWSTATEVNNHGFEVERRAIDNGQLKTDNWSKVGFVEGNGTSNAPNDYSFSDKNISTGKYSYRLKQIDRDGKFEYSTEVEVSVAAAPAKFELAQNYPNPFNPSTTISFTLQQTGLTTLKIFNAVGQVVATLVNDVLEAGTYHQKVFDARNLASGVYFARLVSGNQTQMKKILLMK